MLTKISYLLLISILYCNENDLLNKKRKPSIQNFSMVPADIKVLHINGKPASMFATNQKNFILEPGKYTITVTMAKQKDKLKAGTVIERDFLDDISGKRFIRFESKEGDTIFLCPNIDFHNGLWFPTATKPLYFKSRKFQKYPEMCFGYDSYMNYLSHSDRIYITKFNKNQTKLPNEEHKKIMESYACAIEEADSQSTCISRIISNSDLNSNTGKTRSREIKSILKKNKINVNNLIINSTPECEFGICGRSYFYLGHHKECKSKDPEIKCLKGDCKDSLSILKDDKRRTYEGGFKDGFPHGKGNRQTIKCGKIEMEEYGLFEDNWLVDGIKKKNYAWHQEIEEGKFFGTKFSDGISYNKNIEEDKFTDFAFFEDGQEIISIHEKEEEKVRWIRKEIKNQFEVIYISLDGKEWSLGYGDEKFENYKEISCKMSTDVSKLCRKYASLFQKSDCSKFSKVIDLVCKAPPLNWKEFSSKKNSASNSKISSELFHFEN